MRMRNLLLASTVLAASATGAARADTITGPYISLGGGYNILMDEGVHFAPTSDATGGHYSWSDGATGQASIGYGLGNGLRIELEGDYLYSSVRELGGASSPGSTTGRQESYGALVNVLYDLDLTSYGINTYGVTPYVGVGAGYNWTHLSPLSTVGAGSVDRVGGTNGNFAYQGIIGVAYPFGIPGLAATLEYRFLGDINQQAYSVTHDQPFGVNKGNADFTDSFNHTFLVGLRYALYQPAPPPPPAPPQQAAVPTPAPARTYLVFFDWDRADLTQRARQIIGEAAQASTRVQTTRIEVNGYTDLSGTARYNQGLSVRRARSVEAELIRDGVQRSEISIHGFGESNPLVPTAQGVREPQNRRVEIILR